MTASDRAILSARWHALGGLRYTRGLSAKRRAGLADRTLVGRGGAAGSHRALARENCATVVCLLEGCGALVHLHAARRQARAAGRVHFEAGDGCAGPECSQNFRRAQFAAAQRRMAAALQAEEPERFLAEWPAAGLLDPDVWYHEQDVAEDAASHALARL